MPLEAVKEQIDRNRYGEEKEKDEDEWAMDRERRE